MTQPDATARIYAPTDADATEAIAVEACESFGGYTMLSGKGGWQDDDGEHVQESVDVFLIHATPEQVPTRPSDALRHFADWAAGQLLDAGESEVIAEVNGEVMHWSE